MPGGVAALIVALFASGPQVSPVRPVAAPYTWPPSGLGSGLGGVSLVSTPARGSVLYWLGVSVARCQGGMELEPDHRLERLLVDGGRTPLDVLSSRLFVLRSTNVTFRPLVELDGEVFAFRDFDGGAELVRLGGPGESAIAEAVSLPEPSRPSGSGASDGVTRMLAWQLDPGDGGAPAIAVATSPAAAPLSLSSPSLLASNADQPRACAEGDGVRFVWRSTGAAARVHSERLSVDGGTTGQVTLAGAAAWRDRLFAVSTPALSAAGWLESEVDGGAWVQRFDSSGTLVGGPVLLPSSGRASPPAAIAWDDEIVVIYPNAASSRRELSAVRFLRDGGMTVEPPRLGLPASSESILHVSAAVDGEGLLLLYARESGGNCSDIMTARLVDLGAGLSWDGDPPRLVAPCASPSPVTLAPLSGETWAGWEELGGTNEGTRQTKAVRVRAGPAVTGTPATLGTANLGTYYAPSFAPATDRVVGAGGYMLNNLRTVGVASYRIRIDGGTTTTLLPYDEGGDDAVGVACRAEACLVGWGRPGTLEGLLLSADGGEARFSTPIGGTALVRPAWAATLEGFAATWLRGDGTLGDVELALLGPRGELRAGPLTVARTARRGEPPAIASVGSQVVLAWTDLRAGGTPDIALARVDAQGTLLDPAGILASVDSAPDHFPQLAAEGSGAVVVWARYEGLNRFELHAARLRSDGVIASAQSSRVLGGPTDDRLPSAVAFGDGGLLVAFRRVDRANTVGFLELHFTPQGAPCSEGWACGTGACVDGVCCERDCGSCGVCALAVGAPVSGVCAPRPDGADCPAGSCQAGTCVAPDAGSAADAGEHRSYRVGCGCGAGGSAAGLALAALLALLRPSRRRAHRDRLAGPMPTFPKTVEPPSTTSSRPCWLRV